MAQRGDRSAPGTVPGTVSVSVGLGRRIARAPGAWIAAVLLLGAIGFAALAAHQTAHLARIRGDGLATDGAVVVSADARWPGVAPGDVVVGVAGRPIADRTAAHRFAEVPVHDDATVTFRRGDTTFTVAATAESLPPFHGATAWMRFLDAALIVLLGALGFALRPGTRIGWLFFLFCVSIEANLLFPLALAPWLVVFPAAQAATFSLSTALGIHTFCEMPRRPGWVERRPWLPALLYVPPALILLGVALDPHSHTPGLAAGMFSLLGCIATLGLLLAGAARARREADARLAPQYRVLIAGVTIGLLVPVAFHVFREVNGLDQKWLVHLNAVPVVVYPAAVAWSLLRQNVLGADRYTATVVAYAATLAVVGAGCAAVLIGLPLALSGRVGSSPLVLVATTAAASLGAAPLYRRLKAAVDRRFQRHGASAEQLNARLREVVRLVATGDRDAAIAGAFDAVALLGGERAALYVLDPARRELVRERWSGEGGEVDALAAAGPLGAALRLDAPGGVDAFSAAPLPYEAQDELWAMGLALAAAIPARGVVAGMLAVGPRSSGSRYTAAEQSYLALLAAQVGLVLERGTDGGQIGRYRVERRLGVGGMAEVHLAWQVGPGGFERRVALKRPLPHVTEDPELVAMFLDEARLAANLRHPNIAQVLEVGRDGGTYFIAMEYVDGVSLRTLLRANGRRPVKIARALAIADALLRALGAAHDATDARDRPLGLVHRDVTPSNVLLSVDGEVKLVDFGVALAAARLQVTRAGTVKGTPTYMSPEQKSGRDVDRRSDVFAAGVILHELLAGRTPWADGPPPRPPSRPAVMPLGDDVDPRVHAVVTRALEWSPSQRFATAEEMRVALLAACAPIVPEPAAELAAAVLAARDSAAAAQHTDEPTLLAAASTDADVPPTMPGAK
jgi:hypothetical protein